MPDLGLGGTLPESIPPPGAAGPQDNPAPVTALAAGDLAAGDLAPGDLAPGAGPSRWAVPAGARLVPGGATAVHLVSLVASLAFWAWTDRGLWFFGDEWDFLADRGLSRSLTSSAGIWYPHNEHWSTLPILMWRALFNVFHLSSYWPYLVPLLLAHVIVMHLAWRLCLRVDADPWVATGLVAVLGFLGAGAEDLTWAFQIGFVASVMFGLYALAVVDQPNRRPLGLPNGVVASVALLASLMCSAAGVAMLVGAMILAVARTGWAPALRAVGVPIVVYVVWYEVVGHLGLVSHSDRVTWASVTGTPAYVWTGLAGDLGQTANLAPAGGALLVLLGVWVGTRGSTVWRQRPVLVALGAATLAFYVLAALGRDNTTVSPDVSRYVYVAFALLCPLLAYALSGQRRTVGSRVAVLALCAVTLVGNLGQAQTWVTSRRATTSALKTEVLSTAKLLGGDVKDINGPEGEPVVADPNLSANGERRLERDGDMPAATLSAQDLVNARGLIAVGLGRDPLTSGRFFVSSTIYAKSAAAGPGCTTFTPTVSSIAMQVRLRVHAGDKGAVARLMAPPAPAGSIDYLAAVLAPTHGPSGTVANEMEVSPTGSAYLSYNDPGAELVLLWDVGTPLTLCGLSPKP